MLTSGEAEYQARRRDPHLEKRLSYGGQGRARPPRGRQIVEADDLSIVGNVEPQVSGRQVDPQSLEVVQREDGRGPSRRVELQQRPPLPDARVNIEVAVANEPL